MDRLACIDVPVLPLQLLLRREPGWAEWPVAVVDEDKPTGLVLWVNRRARAGGVRPGARYGASLDLVPTLRAGPVPPADVARGVDEIVERLRAFTPAIEASAEQPGVFWADAGGFERLYASPAAWAGGVRDALNALGFLTGVAVGFNRFATFAVAQAIHARENVVFDAPAAEREAMRAVPLELVGLEPRVRDQLRQLGVLTVGDFMALPPAGVLKRFGQGGLRLHRLATGELAPPLDPRPYVAPIAATLDLGYREHDATRLVFTLKPLVDDLLARLADRGQALAELHVRLELDEAPPREERLRPAEPTLVGKAVMELVALRLEGQALTAPVVALALSVEPAPASVEQLKAFAAGHKRDPKAAARAFARLRAAFGRDDVVVRAVLRDRHLPEARCGWEPIADLPPALPRPDAGAVLVRRLLARPRALPDPGPLDARSGPYRVAGGWWIKEVHRDYWFLALRRGDLLWAFQDGARPGVFLHGSVT